MHMIGKLERPYIDKLRGLAPCLGFVVDETPKYADGHYNPDLVWKKGDKTVGFEVEYGDVDGKKIVGDAFWLCRTFDMGFIQVINPRCFVRFEKLIKYLRDDFKSKVHVISSDLEEIRRILERNKAPSDEAVLEALRQIWSETKKATYSRAISDKLGIKDSDFGRGAVRRAMWRLKAKGSVKITTKEGERIKFYFEPI